MCPHGWLSLVGSDVSFYVSKIILYPTTEFHIGRTNSGATPITEGAFGHIPHFRKFFRADETRTVIRCARLADGQLAGFPVSIRLTECAGNRGGLRIVYVVSPHEGNVRGWRRNVQDFCVSVLIASGYPTTGLPTPQIVAPRGRLRFLLNPFKPVNSAASVSARSAYGVSTKASGVYTLDWRTATELKLAKLDADYEKTIARLEGK